jgi:maltokinase
MAPVQLSPGHLSEELMSLIGPYMARQRWFAGEGVPRAVRTAGSGVLAAPVGPSGRLLWALIDADGSSYQLVIAERSGHGGAEHLAGHEGALIGDIGENSYYDATIDNEMALVLLEVASNGAERASRARPLGAEQSNSSIVYDDRLILKLFRRPSSGANADVEVSSALASLGFGHVAAPLVRWRRDGRDLAFGQQYLAGGTDGWDLALSSLQDFYGVGERPTPSRLVPGDFAAEARRLGQMTAEMHLVMADAFFTSSWPGADWEDFVASLAVGAEALGPELAGPAALLFERLRAVRDLGPALQVHGDYHLGQVMRADGGWYVLDFEGEPNRPVEERLRPTSVMKDVAGMLRSFQYVARFALRGLGADRDKGGPGNLEPLARAWEDRNREAFLRGYLECQGIDELLPRSPEDRKAVQLAFELDKALYELAYEKAFRPSWRAIPLDALGRLLSAERSLGSKISRQQGL